jgi:hypothetical protein
LAMQVVLRRLVPILGVDVSRGTIQLEL